MPTIAEIADYLNDFAPTSTAAEWDNVGLILGERAAPVAKILTCLTVTPEVVAEAVRDGVNLIVTHHPMLFRAIQKITDATPQGRMVLSTRPSAKAVQRLKAKISEATRKNLTLLDVELVAVVLKNR